MRRYPHLSARTCAALAVAGFTLAGAPAFAQTVEELTVTGRVGPSEAPRTLSRAVSYADLDLTTDVGRDTLKTRITTTARDLCRELGETPTPNLSMESCDSVAVKGATAQMDVAIAEAKPRTGGAAVAVAPPPPPAPSAAPAATTYGTGASVTVSTVTNGPVPDTVENRRKYGGPMSRAGRRTAARGN